MAEITSTSTLDSNPGAARRAIGPSWPTSIFDHLPVAADGRTVGETDTIALNSVLERLNVPGFDHRNGRQSNIEAYAAAHAKVYDAAGKAAVAQWLKGGA